MGAVSIAGVFKFNHVHYAVLLWLCVGNALIVQAISLALSF